MKRMSQRRFDAFALLAVVVMTASTGGMLVQSCADDECRERALDPNNVTLCRGQAYAVKALGVVECGCHGK